MRERINNKSNNKPVIIISGIDLCGEITGIPRYVFEISKKIDKIYNSDKLDIRICYPRGKTFPTNEFHRIKVVPIDADGKRWMSQALYGYCKQEGGVICNMSGGLDLSRNGITVLHDIRPLETKYNTLKTQIIERIRYFCIRKNASALVTVSFFQKNRIQKHFRDLRVEVIPPGWEHMLSFSRDDNIFSRFPDLKRNQYFYSIGSRDPHKNYCWIEEIAKRNPKIQFVIAGKGLCDSVVGSIKNIKYVGYISDNENLSLILNCKALLCPSKYEGFGLTPLEAISLEKPVVLSNIPVFQEIYGDIATFFDPDDYSFDVNQEYVLNKIKAKDLLSKYSWEKSAEKWIRLFEELYYVN